MLKLISKIFGTKSDKDIKKMMPLVELTKKEGEKLTSMSSLPQSRDFFHDEIYESPSLIISTDK